MLDADLAGVNEYLIPYFKDVPHFQGRDSVLRQIHDILFDGQTTEGLTTCALSGLARVGKSSLAKHFALTYRPRYDGVFWVSAESTERVEKDFRNIETEILSKSRKSFREWCATEGQKRWLLIVDNLDDPQVFDPDQWIPEFGFGHAIYTSRRRDIKSLGQPVEIVPLMPSPAAEFNFPRIVKRLPPIESLQKTSWRHSNIYP
jgi:hypothetical protein